MSNTTKTGNTNTRRSRGDTRRNGPQLYKGAYMVPASKDWVFRQRTKKDGSPGSQTELLEANPEVTRIWVDKRENSRPSEQGDLLRVEISGKNKEAVEACYAEARQKILDSLAYDRKKAETKHANKQRYQQRHPRPREFTDSDEIQAGDGALMQSFKLAQQKAKSKPKKAPAGAAAEEAVEAVEDAEQVARVKKANPFGALIKDDDEFEQAQARRNVGKNRKARRDEARAAQPKTVADMFADAPALPSAPLAVREAPKVSGSGWAQMAAKPKKVEVVKKVEEPMVRFVTLAKKPVTRAKSEALWDQDDEFPIPGEMTWNEATVDTGGNGWDDWD